MRYVLMCRLDMGMIENYVLSCLFVVHFLTHGHAFSSQQLMLHFFSQLFMPCFSFQRSHFKLFCPTFQLALARQKGSYLFTPGVSGQQPPTTHLPMYLLMCNVTIYIYIYMCTHTHTHKGGHSINNVNFYMVLAIGNTVYSFSFFFQNDSDGSFHVSEDCQFYLFIDYCTQNVFFTRKSVCFHCMDWLFDSGLKWQALL